MWIDSAARHLLRVPLRSLTAPRGLLQGFRSDPTVAAAFATFVELKDQRAHTLRSAHDAAATALWGYTMAPPSQHWLRRLRSFISPLPPHCTGSRGHTLVGPCTKKLCIGKANNARRPSRREPQPELAHHTRRAMALVHRLMCVWLRDAPPCLRTP